MTAGFNFNNYAAGFCSATPGVKGKQRISQWAKSNIRMEGVQGSAKKQRWRFILISAPLPDR
ncbi:TPA: hypothetical protein JZF42_003224 [Escherichia coli]|nr:hypothetical protein [Escherichia coli]